MNEGAIFMVEEVRLLDIYNTMLVHFSLECYAF